MTEEIERKFRVDSLPSVDQQGTGVRMRQGYLAEDNDVAVRVRITATEAVLTVKAGAGLVRTEVNVLISAEEAEALWVHTAGRRIDKVRYKIPVPGATAELDVYGGELEGVLTVEVEFASVQAAESFAPPDWFGLELTDDPRWTNAALARHGRPS